MEKKWRPSEISQIVVGTKNKYHRQVRPSTKFFTYRMKNQDEYESKFDQHVFRDPDWRSHDYTNIFRIRYLSGWLSQYF